MNNLLLFNYENASKFQANLASKAKNFCKGLLEKGNFQRGDYEYLIQLVFLFLGGELANFKFRQPMACHEARFMSDAIYILVLHMTSPFLNILRKA